ncbi:MAG TPA: phosphoribosylanthranilate isomerase [Prolixibacteraceae bacterium]
MIIKVCGMRDALNIKQIAAIEGVDLIGMIFYPSSPRYVNSQVTADSVASLKETGRVGVFVNERLEVVVQKSTFYHLDYLQLHGNETPEYLAALKKLIADNIRFIKAFSIRSEKDIDLTMDYEGLCDYFLFDTPTSKYGGSGLTFDWNILQKYAGATPFLLGGGIAPDSFDELDKFQHLRWAGVDLNSRFETAPGLKDDALITDFIKNIKLLHS